MSAFNARQTFDARGNMFLVMALDPSMGGGCAVLRINKADIANGKAQGIVVAKDLGTLERAEAEADRLRKAALT